MQPQVKVRKFKMQTKYPHQRSEGTRGTRGMPPPCNLTDCDSVNCSTKHKETT